MRYWILLGIIAFLIISIIGWYILSYSSSIQPTTLKPASKARATFPSNTRFPNHKPPWIANLSDVERSFFNTPGTNASTEEKKAFADLLQKNSRTSSGIHIAADCQPSPLIFSSDKTLSLNVTNADSVEHTIIMGKNERYSISPASSSAIKIGTDRKGTLLGYGCDNYPVVGFLIIAP